MHKKCCYYLRHDEVCAGHPVSERERGRGREEEGEGERGGGGREMERRGRGRERRGREKGERRGKKVMDCIIM